jgi:glycerol-3-phosphate dehydrogenase (NAD(P)+)
MTKIAVVGAGNMGTATAYPLADNGHQVNLIGTHLDDEEIRWCLAHGEHPRLKRPLPDNVQSYYFEQLAEGVEGAEVILSGVNSLGVHWIGRTLASVLKPGMMVIAVTKGIEAGPAGEFRILPDVLAFELPTELQTTVPMAAIAGPCLAAELAARRHSVVIFTGRDERALVRLREIFQTDYYHVWLSNDVVGVEACSALKNAYTIGVGAAGGMLDRAGGPDELGVAMHNLSAAIFGADALEMNRILQLVGGRPERMIGPSWAGDHFVTVTGGRTYRLGRALGRGLTYREAAAELNEPTLEGAFVVEQMARVLPAWETAGMIGPDELPLMRLLIRVITQNEPYQVPWVDLYGTGQIWL